MGKALRQVVLPACVGSIVLVPIVLTLLYAVSAGSNIDGWRQLLTDPRLPRALVLTVSTGVVATAVAIAATGYMLGLVFHSNRWQAATASLGPILAVPHAALAVALILWVAPSGILLRMVSPWPSGFDLPPDVALANDPFGLGLTISLVLKETPFLLWSAMSQLQRADVGARLRAELSVCYSLGYSRIQAWWKIAWPQVWPRLAAPIFAVLAYNLTVVDVAQVIGPQSPPTLALLTWQWLADSQTDVNAQGAAAAWMLAICVAVVAAIFAGVGAWLRKPRSSPTGLRRASPVAEALSRPALWSTLPTLYGLLFAALVAMSVVGLWQFPALWPQTVTISAWTVVIQNSNVLLSTVSLALGSAALALIWCVAWLECAPDQANALVRRLATMPLFLPGVLWVIGLHQLAVILGLDGTSLGLLAAHTLAAIPYVLISLTPAYLGFDPRYAHVSQSLGRSPLTTLVRIKWPILKASLAFSFAVGVSVSITQFVTTLYIGAGRTETVTTQAVALSSGGARNVMAAYATLQWILMTMAFAAAAALGRARFSNQHA